MPDVLYITEPTFDYNLLNSNSKLLAKLVDELPYDEYHTSLGDLTADQILKISKKFKNVNLVEQGFDKTSDVYKESKLIVDYLSETKHAIELFTNHREILSRPDCPTLWTFGCSHSAGIGLLPGQKKFAEILADKLTLPLKLVAQPGSSLHWSLRHLMNAPIKDVDTVVWQLTTPNRTTVYKNKNLSEVRLTTSSDRCLLDVLNDDQIYFNHMTLLNFGVEYLRSLGTKFVITSLESHDDIYKYRSEYVKYPEYCYVPNIRLDLGTDNIHVGPLSHQALANYLLDRLYYFDE